jgi:hypothetical protein
MLLRRVMHPRVWLERLRLKSDLINWIGWQQRYASYLEVATPTTGHQFGLVARDIYTDCRRVLYRADRAADDGTTLRTPFGDSGTGLGSLIASAVRFDLVFVDPYHSHDCSRGDLERGLALLAPGGTLVVHDCHPTRASLAVAEPRDDEWMGHTYVAFLDFVRDRVELDFCVVDMDYGCGVIRRRVDWPEGSRLGTRRDTAALDTTDYSVWSEYTSHRTNLLQLVSPSEFVQRARVRPPSLVTRAWRGFGLRAPLVNRLDRS